MKTLRPIAFALIAVFCSASGFAQLTPAAPASGGAAEKTEKAKPLSSSDKKFLKDSTESIYLILELVGQGRTAASNEAVKTLSGKMKGDLDKAWGDIGGLATDRGETLPTELKGSDKTAADRLKKADGSKWDKEFLKATDKEFKKLARTLETGKSVQDPELKTAAERWASTMAGYAAEIDKAEKDLKAK